MATEDEARPSVRDRRAQFEAPNGASVATSSGDTGSRVSKAKRLFEKSKNAAQTPRFKPALPPKPKDLDSRKSIFPPPVPKHAPPAIPERPFSLRRKSWTDNNNCNQSNESQSQQNNQFQHRSSVDGSDSARDSVISDDGPSPAANENVDSSADDSASTDDTSDQGDDEPYGSQFNHLKDYFEEEGPGTFSKQDTLHTSVINQMKREGLFEGLAEYRKQQAATTPSSMDDDSKSTQEDFADGHDSGVHNDGDLAADGDEAAMVTLRPPPQVPPHRTSVVKISKYPCDDPKEEKRLINLENCVLEMAINEERFTRVLTHMVKDYPRYLKHVEEKQGNTCPQEYQKLIEEITALLSPVLSIHDAMLANFEEMAQNWDSRNPNLAGVMMPSLDYLKICGPYVVNKPMLCREYKKIYDRNKQFAWATFRFENEVMNFNEGFVSRFASYQYAPPQSMVVSQGTGITYVQQMDLIHQNVVRYKLFVNRYMELLPPGHSELPNAEIIMRKLDQVVNAIDEKLGEEEKLKFQYDLQVKLNGKFDVLKPGRKLIMHAELQRQARKDRIDQLVVLFSDVLLMCKPKCQSLRQIPVSNLRVEVEDNSERDCWFIIYSHQKTTAILCPTKDIRNKWVEEINSTKQIFMASLMSRNRNNNALSEETPEVAFQALWIADEDATMCMMQDCAKRFSVISRKHHCRVCGYIICNRCSGFAPVKSEGYRTNRVCPECFYETQELFLSGKFFPEYMIVWSSSAKNHNFSMNSSEFRILYKTGKYHSAKELFESPKNGHRKRSEKLDTQEKFLICGTVWMKNGQCYARLCRDFMLYIYAARYDPCYMHSFTIQGYVWSSKSLKSDRTRFRLVPNSTSPRHSIDFDVADKQASLWESALEKLLQSSNMNPASNDSD
uniref:DH domain-containing protein n=1 Tax=Panagrellus redivivus TaxID=6233 RepID=A0A7E4V6W8_PANRE